jgi:hypothetical protein
VKDTCSYGVCARASAPGDDDHGGIQRMVPAHNRAAASPNNHATTIAYTDIAIEGRLAHDGVVVYSPRKLLNCRDMAYSDICE